MLERANLASRERALRKRSGRRVADLVLFGVSMLAYVLFAAQFPTPPIFEILNFAIFLSSLLWIFVIDKSSLSLRHIFFMCCIIFYGVAPRLEYNQKIIYWFGHSSVFGAYEFTALLALAGMWIYGLAFQFALKREVNGLRKISRRIGEAANHHLTPLRLSPFRLVLISFLAVVVIYFVNGFSFINVFYRNTIEDGQALQLPGEVALIYSITIRPLPSVIFVLYMLFGDRKAKVAAILFAFMLVGNPITGFARWQGAMLYIAALLAVFPRVMLIRHSVITILICGLLLVFPLLDFFRRFSEGKEFALSFSWIRAGHFDSFQNFARAVDVDFISYGNQLLGVLLFFVPRAMWAEKPVGTGMELARMSGLRLETIGMNYLGEGYANFGIIGVFLFAIAFGLFSGHLDRNFWRNQNSSRALYVFYLFFLGGSVFVFRGSLLSAFAFMIGTISAVFLSMILAGRRTARGR